MNRGTGSAAAAVGPRSARKRLYALHAWVGFQLAAIMALVLATGTIATLSNEIDWLLQHDMRVTPDGERVSWGRIAEAVQAHRPEAHLITLQDMGGDHFAFRARVEDPYGRQTFVHVDQWTGEVTGETHPLTVQRFFRDLHRYLFMPNYLGLPIVSAMAFVLGISLYTGLKTARNWRTLMFRVRARKGPRVLVGDAHKAAGLWGSWFFVVMIVTGIWYLAEFGAAIGGARFEPPRPALGEARIEALGPVIRDADTDAYLEVVEAVFPELRPTAIHFPFSVGHAVTVLGHVSNPLLRQRANRVFLDPVSLEVLRVQRDTDISWTAYLNEMADPLHFGNFAGLPTKLIWFVFGLAMTGLSLTGVWLTWRRLDDKSPSRAQIATLPVLMLSALFFFAWLDRQLGPEVPAGERLLAHAALPGGGTVEMRLALAADGSPSGRILAVTKADEGRPNVASAAVDIGGRTFSANAKGTGPVVVVALDVPDQLLTDPQTLHLRLELRDGGVVQLAAGNARSR
jgi:uncharacterized iron-regulated membrane protein